MVACEEYQGVVQRDDGDSNSIARVIVSTTPSRPFPIPEQLWKPMQRRQLTVSNRDSISAVVGSRVYTNILSVSGAFYWV